MIDGLTKRLLLLANLASLLLFSPILLAQAEEADFTAAKTSMMQRVDALLSEIEQQVKQDTQQQEQVARQEAQQAGIDKTNASAQRAAQLEDIKVRLQRDRLRTKLQFWSTGDRDFIAALEVSEINALMAEARSVAAHFGLNVERYGKLYAIGKNAIRRSGFVLSDHIPPDQREDLASYFDEFFTSTHERRREVAEFRARLQEYKVVLTKRVTFAYIRALLSAPDAVANCQFNEEASQRVSFNGATFRSLGCDDPVLAELRQYVQAVQKIAGAEADLFASEADYLIAEQTLMNDLAAGLPLVGDAIDMYSLYSGENLAGQCLDRTSMAITAVFSIIPFVPARWWTYAIKRFGLEDHLTQLALLAAEWAEYGGKNLDGFVAWAGVPEKTLLDVQEFLFTEINVLSKPYGIQGRSTITKSAAGPLATKLSADEIANENLKLVQKAKVAFAELPADVRAEAQRRSAKLLRENLEGLQRSKQHVIDASNMVPEHVEEFIKLARQEDTVILFRSVNADATELLRANYGTKWMTVKPKSADWGPHRGFLPFDQGFSKLANPERLKKLNPSQLAEAMQEIAEYSDKAKKCLQSPECFKIPLELPDKKTVHVWSKGDDKIAVLRTPEGTYLDADNLQPLREITGELPPMEVMAGRNANGDLVPLTADYDLLAVGNKKETHKALSSEITGAATAEEREIVEKINQAGKRAGFEGGNLSHHGPENQFHLSKGALSEDPVITAIHPSKGAVTIPRCDRACFVKWCQTSKQCGALPICEARSPSVPCLPVDPDRLLKTFMHEARLDGYTNLRPNATWDWGQSNGLSGWPPKVMLEHNPSDASKTVFGQYSPGNGLVDTIKATSTRTSGRAAQVTTKAAQQALKYLFSCPETSIKKEVWKLAESS